MSFTTCYLLSFVARHYTDTELECKNNILLVYGITRSKQLPDTSCTGQVAFETERPVPHRRSGSELMSTFKNKTRLQIT